MNKRTDNALYCAWFVLLGAMAALAIALPPAVHWLRNHGFFVRDWWVAIVWLLSSIGAAVFAAIEIHRAGDGPASCPRCKGELRKDSALRFCPRCGTLLPTSEPQAGYDLTETHSPPAKSHERYPP